MKRIIALISAVLLCIGMTACSSKPGNSTFKGKKPWDSVLSTLYEYSEYAVTRNYIDNGNEITVGEGKMTFTLEHTTLLDNDSVPQTFLHLTMNFAMTYKDDDVAGIDRGLTDKISSEVIFTTEGLSPIWMHKKAEIAKRDDGNLNGVTTNYSYETEACYNKNYYGDFFREHYTTEKAYFAAPSFDSGEIKELNLEYATDYYDNEEMFFIIRAMEKLAPGNNLNMYVSSIYDMFNRNKFFTFLINIACNSATAKLKMNDNITSLFPEDRLVDSEDGKAVECIFVQAYIDGKDHGLPIELYYSLQPFASPETSNVLMKMQTSEYDLYTRTLQYRTSYELVNYVIS